MKATRTLTIGASRDAPQAWTETINAFNKVREAVRHFVTETPGVARGAPLTALPLRQDTVLKFEHRVFDKNTPFRVAPHHLDVNHVLQSLQDRWHLTDVIPTFELQVPAGNAVVTCHPSIVRIGAFVDVAATITVVLNEHGRFFISYALKRVVVISAAPDINNEEEEEGPIDEGEAALDLGVAALPEHQGASLNAPPEVPVNMVPEPQLAPPSPVLEESVPIVADVLPIIADVEPVTDQVDATTAVVDVDDLLSPYAQGIDFDIFQ
ncbi:hypothetical protein FRC00_002461 [Tulasnella sp. 408]|nr:hypothetical protein FRC00_002461 [Tulasnella sp. 408]